MTERTDKLVIRNPFVRTLFWALLCAGAIPILLETVGFYFLPSETWTSEAGAYAMAAGVLSAVFLPWVFANGIMIGTNAAEEAKKAIALVASPFFGFMFGYTAVLAAGPMLLAIIAGQKTELTYVIHSADGFSDRRCSAPIDFQNLPFMFDRVCGTEQMREGLYAGHRVAISGRGTSLGIFPSEITKDE